MKYIIELLVYSGILYTAYFLLLREEPRFKFNRLLILGSAIFACLIPIITLPTFSGAESLNEAISIYLPTIEINAQQAQQAMLAHESKLDWWSILAAGYLIISGFFLLRFLISLGYLFSIFKKSNQTKNIGENVFRSSKYPNSFSFFKWIYIPDCVDSKSLNTVYQHELKHSILGHSFDRILFELLIILFWWNPFVYLFKNELIATHEFEVDNYISEGEDKRKYIDAIISQIKSNQDLALVNNINSFIKKRIIMMYKEKSSGKAGIIKYMFFIPLCLSILFIHACNTDEKEQIVDTPITLEEESDVYTKTIVDTITIFDAETYEEEVHIVNSSYEVYRKVDQMPRFPGCEDKTDEEERKECSNMELLKYIYKNIKYPKEAREKGIEGQVVAKFVVAENGRVRDSEVTIMKDIGGGCADAVKRVIYSMNTDNLVWVPGYMNNKAVNTEFVLPVKFKLQ